MESPLRQASCNSAETGQTTMTLFNSTNTRFRNSTIICCAAILILAVARVATAQTSGTETPPVDSTARNTQTVANAGRASWTSDRRNFVVGDIITLLIDDYTISTAIKDNIASDQRNRGLGVTVRIPNTGTRIAGIDSRNDAVQQQRGQQRRENRFQNEMSVRVVSVGQNGLLEVRGTKLIDVDKSRQNVVFSGWVRSQDINSRNMVESYRVADAELTYTSPGSLAKPKQGIISRILGAFWP